MNVDEINNQKQYISYGLFKEKLKSKCEYYGINCIEVDEAYHKLVSPKPFAEALNSSIYNESFFFYF